MKFLGRCFERMLWGSRLLILSGVIAGLCLTVGALSMTVVDVCYLLGKLSTYAEPTLDAASRSA